MRVLVKAPFNQHSGYGSDGIGMTEALMRAGIDIYLEPTHISPPLSDKVAQLLTKPLVAPFDLLVHHVDPGQLGLTPVARRAAKRTVAWTMWEWSTLDNLRGRSTLRKRLADYDLVVGYDTVSSAALAPYVSTNAATVQGGFWPEQWPYVERDWQSPRFGFCMAGALHQRKDPFVAIQAFQELKQELPEEFEPAELHLKTNQPGLHMAMEQWIPKLRVHYDVWPHPVMLDFYASQHCLLAPSRGEGKNLPALEFLSTGGTVIATNWGGHQQWLSSEYAYPLDHGLAADAPTKPECLSARASKDHLKALMLHVFRNRQEAARKGGIGSQVIPRMCSWDAVIGRLFHQLADQTGSKNLLHEYETVNARRQDTVHV